MAPARGRGAGPWLRLAGTGQTPVTPPPPHAGGSRPGAGRGAKFAADVSRRRRRGCCQPAAGPSAPEPARGRRRAPLKPGSLRCPAEENAPWAPSQGGGPAPRSPSCPRLAAGPVAAAIWADLGSICSVLFNAKRGGVADVAAPARAASLPSPLWLLPSNIGEE